MIILYFHKLENKFFILFLFFIPYLIKIELNFFNFLQFYLLSILNSSKPALFDLQWCIITNAHTKMIFDASKHALYIDCDIIERVPKICRLPDRKLSTLKRYCEERQATVSQAWDRLQYR